MLLAVAVDMLRLRAICWNVNSLASCCHILHLRSLEYGALHVGSAAMSHESSVLLNWHRHLYM